MRERGNPALAWQIVADEGDFPYFSSSRHGCHRTLILTTGQFTCGSDLTRNSSPSCPNSGSSTHDLARDLTNIPPYRGGHCFSRLVRESAPRARPRKPSSTGNMYNGNNLIKIS